MSNPVTELLDVLQKEEMLDVVEDIDTALKLAISTIDSIDTAVKAKITEYASKGEYNKIKNIADIPHKAEVASKYLNRIITDMPQDKLTSNKITRALSSVVLDESQLEKHILSHNASYTDPYYFVIDTTRYDLPKHTWRCFVYTFFDLMYSKDATLFNQFVEGIMAKRPSDCIFSNIPNKNNHRIASSDIYVWFCGSANQACLYARALLEAYEIEDTRLVIHWVNHKKDADLTYGEIQVGSRVRHTRLGEGIVQDITNNGDTDLAIIQFEGEEEIKEIQLENGKSDYLVLLDE